MLIASLSRNMAYCSEVVLALLSAHIQKSTMVRASTFTTFIASLQINLLFRRKPHTCSSGSLRVWLRSFFNIGLQFVYTPTWSIRVGQDAPSISSTRQLNIRLRKDLWIISPVMPDTHFLSGNYFASLLIVLKS